MSAVQRGQISDSRLAILMKAAEEGLDSRGPVSVDRSGGGVWEIIENIIFMLLFVLNFKLFYYSFYCFVLHWFVGACSARCVPACAELFFSVC